MKRKKKKKKKKKRNSWRLSNDKVRMQELRIEKALIGNVLAMAQQKVWQN